MKWEWVCYTGRMPVSLGGCRGYKVMNKAVSRGRSMTAVDAVLRMEG